MDKKILVVRSNITSMIEHIAELERLREEREKAEREERMKRDREERERKEAEWKAEHPILDKFTYISHYNYETYSWPGDYCNVRFYEWSDINREPRFFSHTIAFYKFLDLCKINFTDANNNKMKSNKGSYITCIPGTHDIIIGDTYESLKNQYNVAIALKSVPDLPSNNNTPKVLSCVVYNGK